MMSFLNRVFVTLAILAPLAWAQERRPGTDADGKWRGKLYCLAVWAERANPEEPKDVAEAFLNSTELAPRPLQGLGSVSFQIDTVDREAQQWFDHGLACLHLLWDEEAERAFRQVITVDEECTMGYWGLAMANFDRPGRGSYFSRMASGKLRPTTPRHIRGWVNAVARFFEDPAAPLASRLQAFATEVEGFAMNSKRLEAKALLLRQLVLNDYRGGLAVRSPWAVDRLAAEVLAANPQHPSKHTRRFLWMKHRPANLEPAGLLSPELVGENSPAPPWRYLGEAQQAVGQWEASATSLTRAVQAGLTARTNWFNSPVRGPAFEDDCVALTEALSRLGRTREALAVATAMIHQPLPGSVARDGTGKVFWSSACGRGVRAYAQVCHEHALRNELASLPMLTEGVIASLPAQAEVRVEFARWTAVAAAARNEELSPEARAHRQLAAGDHQAAIRILGELTEAQRAAFLPRALWIVAHQRAGRAKDALFGFDQQFRKQAGAADSPLRDHVALREVAALRRMGRAWQLPGTPEALKLTASSRRIVADLGAAFAPAPAFSLPDGREEKITLKSLRGKPAVMIFFLGAGCFQCVEQLHAFLPEAEAYQKAGVPIVAVSTDPISVLKYSIRAEKLGNRPIPFTVLSDEDLATFKRYFVYNEFERRPLHGTIVVGPEGKVRWSHIDNQPFMKPKWLLKEVKRMMVK